MQKIKEEGDSDGRKKAKAYSGEEAGRQSGKKKIEYKRTCTGKGNVRLSGMAASGGKRGNGAGFVSS
jgi:hypothetical protein